MNELRRIVRQQLSKSAPRRQPTPVWQQFARSGPHASAELAQKMLLESHGASRWSARITLDPARIQQLFSKWTHEKRAVPTVRPASMRRAAPAVVDLLDGDGEERAEVDAPDDDDDVEEQDPAQDERAHRGSRRVITAASMEHNAAEDGNVDACAQLGHRSSSSVQ